MTVLAISITHGDRSGISDPWVVFYVYTMPESKKGSKASGSHTTRESSSERAESSAGSNVEDMLRMLIDD